MVQTSNVAMSSSSSPSLVAPPPPPPPRFDPGTIADFLKNKRRDEVLFNLLVNPGSPLTGGGHHHMAPPCETSHGPDFSGLLFDSIKSEDGAAAAATAAASDEALNGELLAFDPVEADLARDSFSLFGGVASHCSDGIELEICSPSRNGSGDAAATAALLNLNFNTFLAQHGSSFLAAAAAAAAAGVAPPPDGPDFAFDASSDVHAQSCSNLVGDWTLPPEAVLLPSQHIGIHHESNNAASSSGSSSYDLQQCDSCQILHCIIHSNGVQDTKLEIHGSDGQSFNAVLHTRFCVDDGFPTTLEQQIVEFPVGNAEYVKQFLLQYSLLRRKEGFVLRHDSTGSFDTGGTSGYGMAPECLNETAASFPKQLGRSLFSDVHSGTDAANAFGKHHHLLGPSKANRSNSLDSLDPADASSLPIKPPKSNAAAQRERTGKLKMSDLAQHFHLPINAAAKELGICPTVLKKICRRNGMRRWPHRKIKSIERIIATLEQTIAEGAGQGDEGIRMEIAMLRNERAQLCAGLLGET